MSPQQQYKQTQHTRVFCLHVVVLILYFILNFQIYFIYHICRRRLLIFAVAFWFRHLALCNIRYRSDKAASGWSVRQPKKKGIFSLSLYSLVALSMLFAAAAAAARKPADWKERHIYNLWNVLHNMRHRLHAVAPIIRPRHTRRCAMPPCLHMLNG